MRPTVAAAVLGACAAAALMAEHLLTAAAIAVALAGVCLRAPRGVRRLYLGGAVAPAVSLFLVWPLLSVEGHRVLWAGPIVPVIGPLDVPVEHLLGAGLNALRLAAVGLAFTAYALLLDHDRLLASAAFARRSALTVALATRLVPTLQRDATGLVEALRGRGVAVAGVRGHARLLSPLVAGSLDRALNLAEAMEARGFGRTGGTRAPGPRWTAADVAGVAAATALVFVGALWL